MKASYLLTGKNIGKIVLRIDENIIEPIASDKVIEDVETRISEIKNSPSVYTNELDILNEYLRIAKLSEASEKEFSESK